MGMKLSNNASSSLAGAIAAGATSLNVAAGEGARFPALGAGDFCMATIVKLVGGSEVREIVKVTARAGDTLTIERGQEGTAATTFAANDRIELRLTAGSLTSEFQRLEDHTDAEAARLDGRIDALGSGGSVDRAAIHAAFLSF